ncbi:hypothetical protein CDL62_16500 [Alkalitalea saponilacus]|uniref:Uncharacterized protein n=1 Tax=Alkalitalea saponilacus TaxID=889453 RepID=A0A1T5D9E9_9BACT|nr:hypothetical protein CDL62_16500 [Alkalitalea saponilacus]SKB68398.1 hypothetical protein SAMN03080601_01038 [Alkalitalea saponilacus]
MQSEKNIGKVHFLQSTLMNNEGVFLHYFPIFITKFIIHDIYPIVSIGYFFDVSQSSTSLSNLS